MGWGSDSDKSSDKVIDRSSTFTSKGSGVIKASETSLAILSPEKPGFSVDDVKQKLEAAGALLKDAKDGDWFIEFGKDSGVLCQGNRAALVYIPVIFRRAVIGHFRPMYRLPLFQEI